MLRASRRFGRPAGVALFFVLEGLVPCLPSRAEDPKLISAIRVEGLATLTEEAVLHYLGLEVGAPLDQRAINRGLQELWSTGLIDDIEVDREPSAEGGETVVVRIRERPALERLEFIGLGRVRQEEVAVLMEKEEIQLHEGDPVRLGELYRLKTLVEETYRSKGFDAVTVHIDLEERPAQKVAVVVRVEEGERRKIGGIDFVGNKAFSDRRLRPAMKNTRAGLLSHLFSTDLFSAAAFHEDLETIREVYRRAGYRDAVVGEARIEERTPATPAGDGQPRLFLTIPIDEGPRWRLGEITIAGNEALSDQRLLEALGEPRGPWLSSRFIDRSVQTIEEIYRNAGYLRARVTVESRERESATADLRLWVEEGDLYTIGRIDFEGNTETRDEVLRRELPAREGEEFRATDLRRGLQRIEQLGCFDLDDEEPVRVSAHDREGSADLVVRGREADRTQVQGGLGWGREDGLSGRFLIKAPCLRGRGEALGLRLEGGSTRERYELFYSVPWFLGKPQRVAGSLFRRKRSVESAETTSESEEVGGAVSYGRSLGLSDAVTLTYERKDIEEGLEGGDPGELSRFASSALWGLYRHDTRDNRADPTRGMRFALSLEYAGGVLGGDRSVLRPELGFSLFQPISRRPVRSLFAFNTEAGRIFPYDSYEISPLEGYFLGGPESVRGFRPGSIWSRDENGELLFEDGLAVGGSKFFQINLEYHLFLVGPLRLVLFADAGDVFPEGRSLDLSDLRTSLGAELRLTLPRFGTPLRLIYAVNPDPLPGDQFESFRLSIGTTF